MIHSWKPSLTMYLRKLSRTTMPSKNDLFVDTSGWAVALDATIALHKDVVQLWLAAMRQKHRLVISNYVIAELVALLSLSRYGLSRTEVITRINVLKSD